MGRPLFVGSFLQVTWWLSASEKEEQSASNDDMRSLMCNLYIKWSDLLIEFLLCR